MSKQSAKQRYTQLMSWLETRPKKTNKKNIGGRKNESRMDYYDKKGYGNRRDSRQNDRVR